MPTRGAPAGIYPIRGLMGLCHLLVDASGRAVFLDTGLVGEPWRLRPLFRRLGLAPRQVDAILLTHGHLDHAGNLPWVRAWTRAPVLAHPAEQAYLDETYVYRGTARWGGWMQRVARPLIGYTPQTIDCPLADGDELPWWGGLKVVHLPGHTEGHCGFYSARHDLLFSGDLFASYGFNTHLSPPIFTSCPEQLPASLRRVQQLNPRRLVPQHYDVFAPELHRQRFDALCRRVLG